MRSSVWRTSVSPRSVVAVCGVAVLGGCVLVLIALWPPPPKWTAPVAEVPPPGSYPTEPLPAGTPAPEYKAAGWINGQPPRSGAPGVRYIVLDIWAPW